MKLAVRAICVAPLLWGALLFPGAARPETTLKDAPSLHRQLAAFFDGGADRSRLRSSDDLAPLRRYPLSATTAYLLMGDDPVELKRHYQVILHEVNALFSPDNLTEEGLVRGMPGETAGKGLSPAFNAFANLELWSLHLIAWKIAAYEDALDYLAWSKSFSETVTLSFYSASRGELLAVASSGRFAAAATPGELLPLVLDRTLGSSARSRLLEKAAERYGKAPTLSGAAEPVGPWSDPAARPVILDLLTNCPGLSEATEAALHRISGVDSAPPNPWTDFWRANPSRRQGLLPGWAPISGLANLTLLLQRESLALDSEIAAWRAGIDTVDAALSSKTIALDSYAASVAAVNRLMSRIGRFSDLVKSPKERWRVAEESKWMRVSPRVKRLVTEGCVVALEELTAVKARLTEGLERSGALAFAFELPFEPLAPGERVPFNAVLSSREPIDVSQTYLHVGDDRFAIGPPAGASRVAANRPLRYEGAFALPMESRRGIVPVVTHLDLLVSGKRIELWKRESVSIAMPYGASVDLPAGRRIERSPVPLTISIRYRSDRDVQGEISGSFMRELVTEPALPARFLISRGTERTQLSLTVAPRARLSPGAYPFSLVVSVGGTAIASCADSLIRPFQWIHLGPFPPSSSLLKEGARYQADLFKRYALENGAEIGWREAPGGAIDVEGALRPDRLYESVEEGSALYYTMVDSPGRLRIRWSLTTGDPVAVWINGLPVLPAVAGGSGRIDGEAELRKGPNSFLVATSWKGTPSPVRFELRDENGLPPAGLNNELPEIIDGWERITAPVVLTKDTPPPRQRMAPASFSLDDRRARQVFLVGTFNNWDPAATPMKRDENGLWRVSLMLKPGRYSYKFVIDRTRKIVDPRNPVSEPDGFGGSSSVIEVK